VLTDEQETVFLDDKLTDFTGFGFSHRRQSDSLRSRSVTCKSAQTEPC